MSAKGIIGGVLGAVVGFFIGGVAGAMYGAAIGFGIGMGLDMRGDVPAAGQPQFQKLDMTTCQEGLAVADLLGTSQLVGNILQYHNNRMVEETEQQKTGKGGGSSQTVTTGYSYYLTWAVAFCKGEVNRLYTIHRGDDMVWEGELDCPESGGMETIVIPGVGSVNFYFGTEDQIADPVLASYTETGLQPPYCGLCYAVFNDCLIGSYNRLPIFKFVLSKQPEFEFHIRNAISTFDYNPAHAIWYILTRMTGLPESYLNETSFSNFASQCWNEARGISILFTGQKEALSWIEQILQHVDGGIRYGIDGKFHLVLLRALTDATELPLVTADEKLEVPSMDRKSWMDTLNEIKVQFPRRMVREGLCPDGCDNFSGDYSPIDDGEERIFTINNDDWNATTCSNLSFMDDGLPEGLKGEFSDLTNLGNGVWQFKYTANENLCLNQPDPQHPVCPEVCGKKFPCCIWDPCFDPELLVWDDESSMETIERNSSGFVYWNGGVSPFHIEISGEGFFTNIAHSLKQITTSNRYAQIWTSGIACGSCAITLTDSCGTVIEKYVRCTQGRWVVDAVIAGTPQTFSYQCSGSVMGNVYYAAQWKLSNCYPISEGCNSESPWLCGWFRSVYAEYGMHTGSGSCIPVCAGDYSHPDARCKYACATMPGLQIAWLTSVQRLKWVC